MFVMLSGNRPATFHRFLRDGEGNVTGKLEFPPRTPVEVNASELEVIRADIGTALLLVDVDANGKGRVREDQTIPKVKPVVAEKASDKPAK